jgi:hypothetical protein
MQFARAVGESVRDLAAYAAAGAISYGAWLAYRPAGFIVGGTLVLVGLYLYEAGRRQVDRTGDRNA